MSSEHPYNLPIGRRYYQAISPDGRYIAQINPTYEVSIGNPTSGRLCLTTMPHLERCNMSFLWSDDSKFLAVPQFSGNRPGIPRHNAVAFGGERMSTDAKYPLFTSPPLSLGSKGD